MKLILVVEDDYATGEMLTDILAAETPYHVVLFSDCWKALRFVEGIKPHLFLLDQHLPHMSGIELYDILQARDDFKGVPAIVISAGLERILQELQARNLIGIAKPFDLDELLQTIDQALS